jgi:cytidylate kinase
MLEGRDISADIRRPEVSQMASKVSAQASVRQRLMALQRELGKGGGVVVEGRDIGTVVFPDADVKFYLDASPEVRARRRYGELRQQGNTYDFTMTQQEMTERDQRDSRRAHAPLRPAPDALVVDTTNLALAEVVDTLLQRVQAARKCS